MLFDAIEFATRAHRGQYRKGTVVPYIVHPLAVMAKLLSTGANEALASAGVLHDCLEDTSTQPAELRDRFGARVLQLVEGGSEPDKSASWEERKQHTMDFLSQQDDQEILWLCLADKLDNTESMVSEINEGVELWSRFKRGREQQGWYFRGLLQIFRQRLVAPQAQPLLQRLERAVATLFNGAP
jgi:(p)ppGpp synthase/HD superfamily hydrolase